MGMSYNKVEQAASAGCVSKFPACGFLADLYRLLQCNELNRGHPAFFCQSQDALRTKESEFVHFGPNT